jgi:hypothetical protein
MVEGDDCRVSFRTQEGVRRGARLFDERVSMGEAEGQRCDTGRKRKREEKGGPRRGGGREGERRE